MLERLKHWLHPSPATATATATTAAAPHPLTHAAGPAVQPTSREGGMGALVIDVRSEREFETAALAGAINLPLPQLEHRIGDLVADKSTPLALYCASGGRSGIACTMLRQLGYANATNAGGLHAASAKLGLPLRR